jgi:hypothetical protein
MQLRTPLLLSGELSLGEVESSFRAELAEAEEWSEAVRQDELTWISEGKDPEAEFVRKYYQEPRMSLHWQEGIWAMAEAHKTISAIIGGLLLAGFCYLVWRWWKRRRTRARSLSRRSQERNIQGPESLAQSG